MELYCLQRQPQHKIQEQLQQQHTNQHHHQQLPQTRNKRLEKLKKLKLREIQSLALEGGDTGRGYCSCDEQWTGSTSSASSPTSVSPTLLQNQTKQDEYQQQPKAQEKLQCQLKLQKSLEGTIVSTTTSAAATVTAIATTATSNITAAQEKTSENGNETNDATGGSGYNRTNKQCNASAAIAKMAVQKQHHPQQQLQQNDNDDKTDMTAGEKLNAINTLTESISFSPGSSSSSSFKTITLRHNPLQQRLKQRHHVRFSDEKNFSD